MTLSWTVPGSDGGSAVTGYEYRVSVNGGSTWSPDWTDVPDGSDSGTDRSDERSYTVTGLDNGVLHTFEVRAVNVVGEGAPASVTSTPVTVPEAPASLMATAGDTEVTLSWTVPGSDGGSAVTEYQYRVSVDGGGTWSPDWTDVPDGSDSGTDRSDERSYTVTGLDNGVLHTFEVRAVNVVGEGAPATATSTPVTVPGAPASLMATAGDTEVTLSWTVPGSDGGSAVTEYQYRYKTSGEFPDEWTDVPDGSDTGTDRSDERSYTVTGLDNGVQHTFEVRAVNVVGEGAPATATAMPMTTSTLPLSLDVIAGDDVVNIAEKAGGFAITGDTGNVSGASVTVTIGSGTLTATSASSGAWTVTVPADASYVTGASVDVTVNATKAGYNAAVELTSTLAVDLVRPSVQTAEVSGTSLELGYSEGLDGSSTPAADAYTVVKTDSSSVTSAVGLATTMPVTVSGSGVAITLDTAVPPGDTVTVGYTVPTGMGAMPLRDTAGNAVEALVAHAVPNVPGAPASVEATAGDTEVTLSWTVPGSDGGSAVTEYQYRVSVDGGGTWSPDWTDVPDGSDTGADRSDERSYTVTGLDNGVLHTFEVRAVNAVGAGGVAEATSTPATPVTVPGAPASLMATAGDTEVGLVWTAPASDGGSAVTGYQYRYKTSGEFPDEWTDVPDGSDTGTDRSDERSYTVTGLDNGVLHTFEVRAVNVVGEGAPATATSTPMTTPTLPLSLDVIAGDDVVNIAEKAGGFVITGDTGSVGGASVTVTIGSGTLTATSASSGAWTVTVPSNASYVTGASVDVTVNATKAGYNAAVELTSTLAVDLVRPSVQTAEVSGTSLELGYSEGLDGSSTPAADAYTVVKTDSSSVTSAVGLASVDPVQVSGSVVTLTLDTAVPPGDTVTVDYTVPTGMGAMPVRDTAGNAVEALDDHAVANVPGAPASLNVAPGDTRVSLDWTAPGSDGGSDITGYEYRVSDDDGTTWSPDWTNVPDGSDTGTDRSDERSYTVTGLDNGVEHTFEVRAVSVVGDGATASATLTPVTSTPVTVPGPPASLNATPGNTQVSLDWTVPASDGGSAVTGYEYRVSDDGGTSWSPDWTNVPDGSDAGTDRSDERFYTVTGLDNGVEHTFEVRAVNVVGDGAPASATATPLTGTRNLWPQFDETSTRENVQVMIPVLTNDTSPNRDSLEVISVTQPMNGTASLISAISLVKYIPNDGFTGTDSFTYTVSDGLETATAAVLITVEASEIDGDENQEWIATATTTSVTEGEVVAIDLATTSKDAIVSEEQSLFATLQIGFLEGTVDDGDFQVEDSNGEILQSHTITPTIHHNGGWIHGLRWFPSKSVGSFTVRAKENEDGGSGNEYLVYWVYVEGLLVGSDVITIKPGT